MHAVIVEMSDGEHALLRGLADYLGELGEAGTNREVIRRGMVLLRNYLAKRDGVAARSRIKFLADEHLVRRQGFGALLPKQDRIVGSLQLPDGTAHLDG